MEHPTFPESIPPKAATRTTGSGQGSVTGGALAFVTPTPGTDANAVDYRANPSHGQTDYVSRDLQASLAARDHPEYEGGTSAGPPPDRTIQSYDLPDQLVNVDRMGEE